MKKIKHVWIKGREPWITMVYLDLTKKFKDIYLYNDDIQFALDYADDIVYRYGFLRCSDILDIYSSIKGECNNTDYELYKHFGWKENPLTRELIKVDNRGALFRINISFKGLI